MKTMTDASLRLMVYHATGIARRSVREDFEAMEAAESSESIPGCQVSPRPHRRVMK